MEKKLMACTGKRVITPPESLRKDLRGLGGRRFSGVVLRDLYVRVLALRSGEKQALLVGLECDKVPYPDRFIRALSEKTGTGEIGIMIFSTHIHTAPVCGMRENEPMNSVENRSPDERKAEQAYVRFMMDQTVQAAEAAMENLRPVRVGWQEGRSAINVNRMQDYEVERTDGTTGTVTALGVNPDGPVDRALFVMRLEEESGQPVAFLMNYAVHNTVMIWADSDGKGGIPISGDLAGTVCALMEKRYPGAVAIWSSGAAGDVNPLWFNEYAFPNEQTGMPDSVSAPGMESAQLALQVLSRRHFADVISTVRRITCEEMTLEGTDAAWIHTPGRRWVKDEEGSGRYTFDNAPAYRVRAQMVLLGNVAFCGFSGELYTTLGWKVKDALQDVHAVVINHVASLLANSGYIFDDDTLHRLEHSAVPVHVPGSGKESNLAPGYMADVLPVTVKGLYGDIRNRNDRRSK